MKNRFLIALFAAAMFLGGSLAGTSWLSGGFTDAQAAEKFDLPGQEIQELAEVYRMIRENYVEDIEGGELIKRAIRGMVSSLDPHSSYLSADEYDNFVGGLTNEEYGGVGIYIGTKDDWIEIIAPIYNSPAQDAGLQSGDVILKIDGESTQGMPVDRAVDKMRGVVDTILKLDILPAGGNSDDIRQVELVRKTIVTPSVLSSLVKEEDKGYGYLRITRFQNKTLEDLVNGINGLYQQNGAPLQGVVLDLRNNPGGYLLAGIGAAAVFLPLGSTVVIEKGRDQQRAKSFTAQPGFYSELQNRDSVRHVPLVVLVNNGSASASEIVAGAIQDHKRGVILGTRTYGKASVQSLVQFATAKGKSALRLTTARYYTPLDRNIQARGIKPDIVINQSEVIQKDEGLVIREDDIAGHLENNSDSAETAGAAGADGDDKQDTRPPFIAEEDYQYDQALQILKALSLTAAR